MMYWYWPSGWSIALMALSMVIFWGLVIVGVVLLLGYLSSDRSGPARPASPALTGTAVTSSRSALASPSTVDKRR